MESLYNVIVIPLVHSKKRTLQGLTFYCPDVSAIVDNWSGNGSDEGKQ